MIHKVSVIGAGTMGNGIAHVFAQSGFTVRLVDVSAAQVEKALQTIAKNFDRQIAKGTIIEAQYIINYGKIISEILQISSIKVSFYNLPFSTP